MPHPNVNDILKIPSIFAGYEIVECSTMTETKTLPIKFVRLKRFISFFTRRPVRAKVIVVPSRAVHMFEGKLLMHPAMAKEIRNAIKKEK